MLTNRREEVAGGDGRTLTVYSGEETRAASDPGHPVSSKFVIRQITYDTGLAREAAWQVLLSSMVVLAVLLPIVFWIAARLLQRQLLDPLFNLRGEAGAIAQGNLEQAIANTDRIDDLYKGLKEQITANKATETAASGAPGGGAPVLH